jgi:hypothetical protein
MSVKARVLTFCAIMTLVWATRPATALDPRYPDWPCQQLKVPEISVASVWSGDPIDNLDKTPPDDPAFNDLVARLAARRTPMEEAKKLVDGYLAPGPDDVRRKKATALFAALFHVLNKQRDEVMTGIERFSRNAKGAAEDIRVKTHKMQQLQDAPDANRAEVDGLVNQLAWETRIFEDRRKSLSYVCEVPTLIEKRLFDLGRAIQDAERKDAPAN